jgi:hypothetical protein
VRLVSPIGGATGGTGNLSTNLFNVAKLAAHSKFVWVFNASCDRTIIYNDPVHVGTNHQRRNEKRYLFADIGDWGD